MRPTPEALSPLLLWAAACVPEGPRGTDEVPDTSPIVDVGSSGVSAAGRITEAWSDHFDRAELGSDWLALSPEWHLDGGKLCGRGAKNHGVWLQKRLPRDVRIEIDAIAGSDEGDLKVEVFGDGRSGATGDSYDDATGYVAILGGWKNTLHVLARLDEHGDDRLAIPIGDASDDARARRVVAGHPYRFVFERRQGDLRWLVDGAVYFDLDDAEPLAGVGHDHFGLNDWDAPVCFDNLEITPL